MIKLSQRLQAIADMVPQGAKVADIGTDHGFLPCYLAQTDKVELAIACDVNAQPLALAQKNIADYNVTDKVSTRLGNGLTVLKPGEVDVWSAVDIGADVEKCGFAGSPTRVLETFENERGKRKCKFNFENER